jgi:acetylornithine deacetylase/succinyl-diaminopimelate desuccinylase-like protein
VPDVVELLQRLIRFDTVNPPGNERPAQEYLASLLEQAGFETTLAGRTAERPNLVARLEGHADGPALCLLSHVDTVLATPHEWTHDPWSGHVDDDGFLWGRGAIDMKSQTAAEVAAAVELASSGWRPAHGTLIVASVVDEETGGGEGAQWLCEHHPDLVRCDYLLNEGGGAVIPTSDGRRVYGVCIAEKGVFRFRLLTDGVAGHASIPRIGDNALTKMAPFLARLADRQPGFDITEGPRALLDGLGLTFEELQASDPRLALLVEPMLGVTLAPTRIAASDKENVIPSRAELLVDCRVPPGHGRETAERRIHEVLGGEGYRLEFVEEVVGNGSPAESPLMEAIAEWVAAEDPDAQVLPIIEPGFTDSRTFRAAFPDLVAYGWFPQRRQTFYDIWSLIHAADERIAVADLEWATRCFEDVTRRLLG